MKFNMNMTIDELVLLFEEKARRLLEGCRVTAHDGTVLYTPDGMGNYKGLWCRDFAYMAEYAGDLIPDGHIKGCIEYLLRGTRESDGWICDWRSASGVPSYSPVGQANLDNAPFLLFAIDACLSRMDKVDALAWFGRWQKLAAQGLKCLPLSPAGLVWNDPEEPHSPYGFTDCIGKTGELFMESVLYWRACGVLAKWYAAGKQMEEALDFTGKAEITRQAAARFRDEATGMFYAATRDCRQLDVWGSAYAAYAGFLSDSEADMVADYFINNYEQVVFRGQVRHLPRGEYWDRLLKDIDREDYQNGAYWAAPAGWVAWVIARKDPELALRMLNDLARCFIDHGVFECVNVNLVKLDKYVASAVNPFAAAQRLRSGQLN